MADKELKNQRKILKSTLTRIYNYCNQENAHIHEIEVRAEKADKLFEKYEQIQSEIDNEEQNEIEKAQEEQYRADMEKIYFSIKAIYYKLKEDINIQTSPRETQNNSQLTEAVQALIHHQTSINSLMERFSNNVLNENISTPMMNEHSPRPNELSLPRIQLPEFDGNLLEWVRFKELFEALIHNRSNITDIEKLEYLQSKLRGEASVLIKHLKPSHSNYPVAWDLLNQKYNKIEKVKAAYMELLFEQPPLKTASLHEMKKFHNSVNEAFNALKAIDDSVNQWNTVLLFNIEKKLDNGTSILWFREKQKVQTATFDQFLVFLDRRVAEIESIQNSSQHSAGNKQQLKQSFTRTYTSSMQSCVVCTKNHFLYQCDEFKKMQVNQRKQIVQKNNICYNCLRDDHKVKDCKSSSCKKCNKRHNTLLHTIKETSVNAQSSINYPEVSPQVINDQTTTDYNQISTLVNSNAVQHESNYASYYQQQ